MGDSTGRKGWCDSGNQGGDESEQRPSDARTLSNDLDGFARRIL
jgi:hypothetical protein